VEAVQRSLFDKQELAPSGLGYWPEFVSAAEERLLVERIAELNLAPFQFGAYEGKRRVVSFGWSYDFSRRHLAPAAPPPSWIAPFASRVEAFGSLKPGAIGHILITEYAPGAAIGWHRDKKDFDLVFGLSLAAACPFRFRRKSGKRWERFTLDVQPRSLYLMTGEARWSWEHSIPPMAALRYSVTFRTLARD
jgi:alkylated DNA repair dioxygenase AlkB